MAWVGEDVNVKITPPRSEHNRGLWIVKRGPVTERRDIRYK